MPPHYLKAQSKHLPPEDMEKALTRYRKALAHGVPSKHLIKSGRFKGVPTDLLCRVSAEERRNRSKHQGKGVG